MTTWIYATFQQASDWISGINWASLVTTKWEDELTDNWDDWLFTSTGWVSITSKGLWNIESTNWEFQGQNWNSWE